jgi:type II secretory ATPase GspE/PulE/Tfp pilus assembly ATPase PilB-like protein
LATYPRDLHEKVVFRIKILSRLHTDEHAAPQDGRFSVTGTSSEGEEPEVFDVRVSILPVQHGENVVMRLLAERSQRYTLADLGFGETDLAKVERASRKPYGMILSVGPTGAGKTTTLYALLSLLNKLEVNIMTIEDPVEYAMAHVQQTQVNEKKKLNFATGLRSIVRQDPDIIMVGEIRDDETASIAVNAAMTGHLLLSTLHANDAATTFPRLSEMNIEPFLVASSVNVIVAQRLARRVCGKCKTHYYLEPDEIALVESEPSLLAAIRKVSGKKDPKKVRCYRGAKQSCDLCGGTGYSGRVGIFEVMEVTDRVKALIAKKAPADDITNVAREEGMTTMLEDGVAKMLSGDTTLEEVVRAVKS